MKVLVSEEYGYKYHIWDFPGTKEDLIADVKAGAIPFYMGRNAKPFRGGVKYYTNDYQDTEVKVLKAMGVEAVVHSHEAPDTYLDLDGKIYYQDVDPRDW